MGYFDITLRTEASLHPFEEPEEFVSEYTGIIRYHRQRDNQSFRVGKAHAYRVHAGLALDHGESLFDVCDAHSQPLHDLYVALYDPETHHFREDVAERFHVIESDCLVLDYVVLHPRWRGLKLGLLCVRKLVDLLGGGCGLAVSEILPLSPDATDLIGVPDSWVPRQSTEEEHLEAKRRLRRHFRRMGFRRIDKTAFYALSMAKRTPTDRDLLGPAT